ncbi:family 1 glycosylhydrolase [Candidatus Gottesmanbacteria bacterium]|nr:family 1 glycosylhydrolase [Candidatus Gottesmanbacteria bacterium]
MYQLNYFQFPKEFKFGVADADLQVIGEKHTLKNENSEPTMWTHFAKKSDIVYQHQSPLDGIDRYHQWKSDIEILKNLGVKDYRTSISISRVMTRGRKPNEKALKWYANYFKLLHKNGVRIYATIYHWELPQYLSELGGWKNRKVVDYLVDHAKIIYEYLGEYIEEYFILNEPFQFTFDSYHNGWHAPGEKNLKGALSAVHNALLAQGMIFKTLKGLNKKLKLSTTYNPSVTYAASSSSLDVKAAQYAFGYHTSMFTDPLYLGKYPDYMMDIFESKMPKIEKGDMETIKVGAGLHTFGVNFYRGKIVKYDPGSETKYTEVKYSQGIANGLGWPIHIPPTYPEALYDLLRELYHRYESYGMKQIIITESGTCWDDKIGKDGKVNDEFRIFFLREHFRQVQKAILAGIPVKGFLVWTLMDNYEWELGYKPGSNFGIVHIDRQTMKRIPKNSYYWYKEVIRSRKLD